MAAILLNGAHLFEQIVVNTLSTSQNMGMVAILLNGAEPFE